MAMDRVSSDYPIFVGSYLSFTNTSTLFDENISTVVSVVGGVLPGKFSDPFNHKQIEIDDDEKTDIMKYFGETNLFIDQALMAINGSDYSEGVLIHCMAGVSRSSTFAIAYLMWKKRMSLSDAFVEVHKHRVSICPNPSFMEQLAIYQQCDYEINDSKKEYTQWLLKKQAEGTRTHGLVPNVQIFRSPSGTLSDSTAANDNSTKLKSQLRCKKCRQPLASSQSFIIHTPKENDTYKWSKSKGSNFGPRNGLLQNSSLAPECMQFYTEPVQWMKEELDQGEYEGKFSCPKCKSKVGSYKWHGSTCSCGEWVTPAIEISRSKVDEVSI
ncbi:dual specificity protein phosphatase 12 [Nadsonia fulvescens var. elongata DSM 6958]|uniref:protein-tyrosine-phosphatase n=1 Tax=Nadsonia fulvescens var. elongata DSM 6958 TaxID=857566 RepID=A0A1E3PPE9_9ASCO|nr:dual specificity protein phosphatase 12 [Nadsonia fulvescens var. elongata DSM 6958]